MFREGNREVRREEIRVENSVPSAKTKNPSRFTSRGSSVGDDLLSLREVSSAAKA